MPSPREGSPPGAPRRQAATLQHPILAIVLSVALIAAVVFLGVLWVRHRTTTAPAAREAKPTANTPLPPPAPPVCTDEALLNMDLRAKLAQLLMVGVTGADDARQVIAKYGVGGIFIGSWTDLTMLKNGELVEITKVPGALPVAVSVDEEGGRVARLSSLIPRADSQRLLAANKTPLDQVRDQARQRGEAMRKLGITVDFAPVVDVSDEDDDDVIGDRSFSNNPQVVTQYADAVAEGLRQAGILPVLKHFPGHGHGNGDTHKNTVVTPDLSVLKTSDLVPYQTLLKQAPVAAMVGHMQVPGLTGDLPASLSKAAYDLLRDGTEYGGPRFDGPVFTDDLSSMRAISDQYGVDEAALMALKAGADTALWITTDQVSAVLDRLQAAVQSGDFPIADVDAKVARMAKAKGRSPQCGSR